MVEEVTSAWAMCSDSESGILYLFGHVKTIYIYANIILYYNSVDGSNNSHNMFPKCFSELSQ